MCRIATSVRTIHLSDFEIGRIHTELPEYEKLPRRYRFTPWYLKTVDRESPFMWNMLTTPANRTGRNTRENDGR